MIINDKIKLHIFLLSNNIVNSMLIRFFSNLNFWKISSFFIIFLLLLPIVAIIIMSYQDNFGIWKHLVNTKLFLYLLNTSLLMLGVAFFTLLIGVSCAWIISQYDFFLSNIIEWALLLPAAIPAYIVAYCYTDFLEYGGLVQSLIRESFNLQSSKDYYFPEIRSMPGAIFMMSFVLYPYVYFITKVAFNSTPRNLLEFAKIHGKSDFFYVAFPLARPAIIAGLSLVLMETISDFGTVEYLAIETLTLGIFNLWLGMNSLSAASQLSLVAFTFIVVLLGLELSARKRQKFNDTKIQHFGKKLKKVNLKKNILYFSICMLPILIGFILPVFILIFLSFDNFDVSSFFQVLEISINSLSISLIGALLIILISFLIAVSVRYHASKNLTYFSIAAGSGYAFPGVILALGTTVVLSMFQEVLNSLFFTLTLDWNIALIGSYSALLFAYVCRFNAIGFGSINSGILRMPPNLLEASRIQGASFKKGLLLIVSPLIRPSILTGLLLVFVDIFKELPMTLLLRPFNFETLATYVYQYAKEEMLEQCALGALFIVLIGIIPIIVLNKAINLSHKR